MKIWECVEPTIDCICCVICIGSLEAWIRLVPVVPLPIIRFRLILCPGTEVLLKVTESSYRMKINRRLRARRAISLHRWEPFNQKGNNARALGIIFWLRVGVLSSGVRRIFGDSDTFFPRISKFWGQFSRHRLGVGPTHRLSYITNLSDKQKTKTKQNPKKQNKHNKKEEKKEGEIRHNVIIFIYLFYLYIYIFGGGA